MKTITLLVSFLLILAAIGPGVMVAQKKSIDPPNDNAMAQLKPGPGRDAVNRTCAICHSTDYIVRQPQLDRNRWKAEVEKMRAVFGAPVSATDAKEIVDYLVKNYGSEAKEKSAKKQRGDLVSVPRWMRRHPTRSQPQSKAYSLLVMLSSIRATQ
jgi:sulfite dehydrogenase (cytochrome) subunit B